MVIKRLHHSEAALVTKKVIDIYFLITYSREIDEEGQLSQASFAVSSVDAVISPYTNATSSSPILNTSGHVSVQRPHPMQLS
jgi:hypothetical protein